MRIIGHIDMDAFFAAIEERDSPQFKGKPLVIGADPKGGAGRGVVSTASYKAREYGIRSAMPITRAWRLAEKARMEGKEPAIFLPGNMKRYGEVSRAIMAIVASLVPVIEQTSVDEAYLDLSFTGSYEAARKLAEKIKKAIYKKENLTATVGIGPNKLMAKIASDLQKPDGLIVITEDKAETVLAPMSVRALPGVGPKSEKVLNEEGIHTVSDLKKHSREELVDWFGKWGRELYDRARGQDDSPLITEWEAKSIGEQETFEEDTRLLSVVLERVNAMAESVLDSLKKEGFKTFRRLVLTVRFDNFTTRTRSRTLPEATNSLKVLKQELMQLLLPFFDKRENPNDRLIRLVGVRVEELG